jgi:cation:H+ antiporter
MRDLPLWLNLVVFAIAATTIWWSGTRLERYADVIARRTGLGQAFTGMLLLAAATSLPEVATTLTAILIFNDATLAVHNLIGGVALQTAILVIADASKGRRGALTFFSPQFVLLIEGVGLLLLLQIVMAGMTAKGVPVVLDVSLWLVLLLGAYVGLMYLVYRYRDQEPWKPTHTAQGEPETEEQEQQQETTTARATLGFAVMSLLVLLGGWAATASAESLAHQTGLGSAFLGATLLALATSLPEVSTTVTAARRGRYATAISNVFGSNAFDVVLLLLADLLYRNGSVLAHSAGSLVFVAALASGMTCIYLWGLMERENRTIWLTGTDSVVVLSVYLGGVTVLYFIQ